MAWRLQLQPSWALLNQTIENTYSVAIGLRQIVCISHRIKEGHLALQRGASYVKTILVGVNPNGYQTILGTAQTRLDSLQDLHRIIEALKNKHKGSPRPKQSLNPTPRLKVPTKRYQTSMSIEPYPRLIWPSQPHF